MLPKRSPSRRASAQVISARLPLISTLILCIIGLSPASANGECDRTRSLDGSCADDGYGYGLGGYAQSPSNDARPALWDGLYVGANIGGAVGGVATRGLTRGDVEVAGLVGGLHAGYSMLWDNLMVGVEFDISRSGADGDRRFSNQVEFTSDVDWLSSSRLRLGYATQNYLFYATGGFAFAQQDLQFESPANTVSDHASLYGYALGAGMEIKLTDSISTRIEAIHYGFGEQTFDVSNDRIEADADLTTFRAGLTMHFN